MILKASKRARASAEKMKIGDHLQVFHCMAHRLELAVHNTVEIESCWSFQDFS